MPSAGMPAACSECSSAADTPAGMSSELVRKGSPAKVSADGAVQSVGARWKLTPSVFVRCTVPGGRPASLPSTLFQCPECAGPLAEGDGSLDCAACSRRWPVRDQIYDFKEPL